MADYYHLYAGKSKKKMTLMMTDILNKVENYKYALEKTKVGSPYKFFEIKEAGTIQEPYRIKNKGGYWKAYNNQQIPRSI